MVDLLQRCELPSSSTSAQIIAEGFGRKKTMVGTLGHQGFPMVKFVRNMGMGMGMGGRKLRKKVLRILLFLCFGWVLNGGFWSSFFFPSLERPYPLVLCHLFPSVCPLRRKNPLTWHVVGKLRRSGGRGVLCAAGKHYNPNGARILITSCITDAEVGWWDGGWDEGRLFRWSGWKWSGWGVTLVYIVHCLYI